MLDFKRRFEDRRNVLADVAKEGLIYYWHFIKIYNNNISRETRVLHHPFLSFTIRAFQHMLILHTAKLYDTTGYGLNRLCKDAKKIAAGLCGSANNQIMAKAQAIEKDIIDKKEIIKKVNALRHNVVAHISRKDRFIVSEKDIFNSVNIELVEFRKLIEWAGNQVNSLSDMYDGQNPFFIPGDELSEAYRDFLTRKIGYSGPLI